jgi:hypothetical protein
VPSLSSLTKFLLGKLEEFGAVGITLRTIIRKLVDGGLFCRHLAGRFYFLHDVNDVLSNS